MSLSLITLELVLRNILQNCGWPIHQNHHTATACSVHISFVPHTPASESCPACIVGVRRGNPD